jgi:secondary thiamine-phosphate synthase enzyme
MIVMSSALETSQNESSKPEYRNPSNSLRVTTRRPQLACELMGVFTSKFTVATPGKGTYEITDRVASLVRESKIENGIVTVFVQHTSCSLIIMESADATARRDLESFFDRLVPENAAYFAHASEGADDMPSHIRMVLTQTSETIPIVNGEIPFGTWQGIFLFEHRRAAHRRKIVATVMGE